MAFQLKMAFLFSSVLLSGFLAEGANLFSLLNRTITVSVTMDNQNTFMSVIKAGTDQLHVTWGLNASAVKPGDDASYKTVYLKLCFGPQSQVDRSWRKSSDVLSKDKTCLFDITTQPYTSTGNTAVWTVAKDVPSGHYFVRAYVADTSGETVAFGQSTNKEKTINLFTIESISGRHASIDIAAGVFSAFSVVSLFTFYFMEKHFAKKSPA